MRWNRESAVRYDKWAGTVRGSFALQQEKKLLQGVIAPWPRRKQKLLDIGCGTGMFLEFFWSCGFDLTGMDKSPDMLARAYADVTELDKVTGWKTFNALADRIQTLEGKSITLMRMHLNHQIGRAHV